jgi:hypothetical protein
MKKTSQHFWNFVHWIKGSLEESPGVASSMRIAAILVTMNIMAVWTYSCIKSGSYQEIGMSSIMFIATIWGCKIVQHFSEK